VAKPACRQAGWYPDIIGVQVAASERLCHDSIGKMAQKSS